MALLALGALLLGLVPVVSQEDYGFMPNGGKTLLLKVIGMPANETELRGIVETQRSETEWREAMTARKKSLNDRELSTLAAYLAVNMPLGQGALEAAAKRGDLASALPADGRELAASQCQFCHSLFSSYLTQSRDVRGWRSTFLSPFHRQMKMTEKEREEFARYSAINMPMKIEDVPTDLRF
jgi:hypothetical protein